MTHYRMLDRVPSAVITTNGNELKLYKGNVVYLNNGDNFELMMFNPLKEKIGIEIIFNGFKKGDSYLVLNPGQNVVLDRFLDEKRKMIFETYSIDGNNSDAVEAIANNGIIDFRFYKESYNYYTPQTTNINWNLKSKKRYTSTGNQGFTGGEGHQGFSGGKGTEQFSTNTFTTTQNTDVNFSNTNSNNELYSTKLEESIETGRIEKGDVSKQDLRVVELIFENTPFHTITYKIMPHSAKSVEIGEIRQYCDQCGYRLRKSNWIYCPKCGNKLI